MIPAARGAWERSNITGGEAAAGEGGVGPGSPKDEEVAASQTDRQAAANNHKFNRFSIRSFYGNGGR